MTNENEQPSDSIDDEIDRFEEQQIELFEITEAKGIIERSFELARKASDETFQRHPENCIRIIEIIEKYDCTRSQWNTLELECLFFKLNELYGTLYDFYFLLMSAKYNSARILLRKWIEIVVISIYFDTTGKYDTNKKKYLDVEHMDNLGFSDKLKKLSNTSCNGDIKRLYQQLSLYTHNEGKKDGQIFPFYHEDEFIDTYSKTNEIQLLMERMIINNCNIYI